MIRDGSLPSDPSEKVTIDESEYVQMEGRALRKKGKWDRFGPEVK
jgi:hypothetical protein